jgi:hypothetical protein
MMEIVSSPLHRQGKAAAAASRRRAAIADRLRLPVVCPATSGAVRTGDSCGKVEHKRRHGKARRPRRGFPPGRLIVILFGASRRITWLATAIGTVAAVALNLVLIWS